MVFMKVGEADKIEFRRLEPSESACGATRKRRRRYMALNESAFIAAQIHLHSFDGRSFVL